MDLRLVTTELGDPSSSSLKLDKKVMKNNNFCSIDKLLGNAGRQFNSKKYGLSFGLKNGLRFSFDSVTCLNYPFLNMFLV